MNIVRRLCLISAAALLFIAICAPQAALATTRIVNPSDSSCSDTNSTPCYTTIAAALAAVTSSSDIIEIHPGTYAEIISLSTGTVPGTIEGTETARTILDGSGGTAISLSGITGITIKNLSFTDASIGIQLTSGASSYIYNNVFRVGSGGTAVDINDTSSATIENNTFYSNNLAINFNSGTNINSPIENNIFSTNTTAAIQSYASSTNSTIDYNMFYNSGSEVTTGTNDVASADPSFVDPSIGDFQLTSASPCINKGDPTLSYNIIDSGTPPDLGAYGGLYADTYPFPVQNVAVTMSSSDATLTWDPNNSYQVAGYKVYYGTSSGSYTTPIDVKDVTSYVITGLSATSSAPTGTTVLTSTASSGALSLSWDAVSGASGYLLLYDTVSTPSLSSSTTTSVDVGNVTTYDLTGLTNGTYYYVTVTPYNASYYFAVTAYYANTSYESAFSSEVNSGINYGTASNTLYDFPEAVTGYPDLPNNGGCFIATAAYGYYSAPQVQALRVFRDRYLIPNRPGRAFVRWYYTYGPIGARYITEHSWLKPVVRAALLPLVALAMFLTHTSFLFKLALLLMLAGPALAYLFYKKRAFRLRGSH